MFGSCSQTCSMLRTSRSALSALLAAWHVFEGARHDEGLTRIDLEA